jgi:N-acetyl-gamma-glutamylphosphate reductase
LGDEADMTRVYVDGQEGTTGLRIREVLAGRDDIDVLSIDPAKRKDPVERAALLNAADDRRRGSRKRRDGAERR